MANLQSHTILQSQLLPLDPVQKNPSQVSHNNTTHISIFNYHTQLVICLTRPPSINIPDKATRVPLPIQWKMTLYLQIKWGWRRCYVWLKTIPAKKYVHIYPYHLYWATLNPPYYNPTPSVCAYWHALQSIEFIWWCTQSGCRGAILFHPQ